MAAPASLSRRIARVGAPSNAPGWLRVFGSNGAKRVLAILAAGELLVDKLPGTPARTTPMSLAARALSGGLCGLVLGTCAGRQRAAATVIGAGAAVAAAFAGFRYRDLVAGRTAAPDALAALVEDAAVVLAARQLRISQSCGGTGDVFANGSASRFAQRAGPRTRRLVARR